jgi:molybdate-binding protein/DNA-binding XRE family transcriptional regulator
MSNRLAEVRKRRGLPAAGLAALAGATRQTIYAIEAGSYMPNTALALRLARALQVSVEDLFELGQETAPSRGEADVDLVPGDQLLKPGQPVQLCRVGRKIIAVASPPVPAYLPAADGVLRETRRPKSTALLFRQEPLSNRLLIAGCDPALSILAAHAKDAGVEIALANCNSSRALELLRGGRIHIAGTHLRDAASGESNLAAVRRKFTPGSVRLVTFASWQEGFVIAPRNPKKIRTAADLARRDVQIVNREPGAGSRILLDQELRRAGVEPRKLRGYGRIARGHLPAAWQVVSGLADCCVATEAAARAFGLDFIPIRSERFDLVIPRELASSPLAEKLLDAMQTSALRRELEVVGGYDTRHTGDAVVWS